LNLISLPHLAPDIQEQILFLPPIKGLNERNLRRIVMRIDWQEQRSMFHKLIGPSNQVAVLGRWIRPRPI
jgi:hypothetical protein